MIDFKEIKDGEVWELFARDFLVKLGFEVESSVDRGADGKKDLIVTERLKGSLGSYKFRWLVSCKHFVQSGKSVSETDEPNILERLRDFKCDGFIGFYSTLPSAGLNTRLTSLKNNRDIKDYRVFDYKLIENYLIRIGYSELLVRYLPNSYKLVKPLHLVFDSYLPLKCQNCDTDLLYKIYEKNFTGLIAFVHDFQKIEDEGVIKYEDKIYDIYWACKGQCDKSLENKFFQTYNVGTAWEDIDDLVMPAHFIKWVLAILNRLENKKDNYSPEAYKKLKYFIMAISQKVLREMTEDEKTRFRDLLELEQYGIS